MSQETATPIGTIALTFLAGAAVGAVVMALTTPKTGPEVRENLKDMGIRMRRKVQGLVDSKEEEIQGAH